MNRLLRSYPLMAFTLVLAVVFGLERLMQLSETPNAQRVWLIHFAWLAFIAGLCRWAAIAGRKETDSGFSPRFLLLGPAFFFSGLILLTMHLVLPRIQQLDGVSSNPFRVYDEWLLIVLCELIGLGMLFCGPFFRMVAEKYRWWVPLVFFSSMAGIYFGAERMIDFASKGMIGNSFFDFVLHHFFLNELPLVVLLVLIVCAAQLLLRFSGWTWFTVGAFAGHFLVFSPRFDLNPISSGMLSLDFGWSMLWIATDERPAYYAIGLLAGVAGILVIFLVRSEKRKKEISVGREDLVD